jgi:hypothetical protein
VRSIKSLRSLDTFLISSEGTHSSIGDYYLVKDSPANAGRSANSLDVVSHSIPSPGVHSSFIFGVGMIVCAVIISTINGEIYAVEYGADANCTTTTTNATNTNCDAGVGAYFTIWMGHCLMALILPCQLLWLIYRSDAVHPLRSLADYCIM